MGRWTLLSLVRCFNPRTREGCDRQSGPDQHTDNLVSIHAPARGATQRATLMILRNEVSIHAPARGATRRQASHSQSVLFQSTHPRGVRRRRCGYHHYSHRFQSTHPRGVRPALLVDVLRPRLVSIHAPARGATGRRGELTLVSRVSIHAPARGATLCRAAGRMWLCGFQSTHPRGVRPDRVDGALRLQRVSIHAPARGATLAPLKL